MNREKFDENIKRLRDDDVSLITLDLSNQELSLEDLRELSEAISNNSTLENLNLENCQIGDGGLLELANSLTVINSLRVLNLRGNLITNFKAECLFSILLKNVSLGYFDLGNNQIGSDGARKIAEGLKENTTLCFLALDNNQFGLEGVKVIIEALGSDDSVLSGLLLAGNGVRAEEVKNLKTFADSKLKVLFEIDSREETLQEWLKLLEEIRVDLLNCSSGSTYSELNLSSLSNSSSPILASSSGFDIERPKNLGPLLLLPFSESSQNSDKKYVFPSSVSKTESEADLGSERQKLSRSLSMNLEVSKTLKRDNAAYLSDNHAISSSEVRVANLENALELDQSSTQFQPIIQGRIKRDSFRKSPDYLIAGPYLGVSEFDRKVFKDPRSSKIGPVGSKLKDKIAAIKIPETEEGLLIKEVFAGLRQVRAVIKSSTLAMPNLSSLNLDKKSGAISKVDLLSKRLLLETSNKSGSRESKKAQRFFEARNASHGLLAVSSKLYYALINRSIRPVNSSVEISSLKEIVKQFDDTQRLIISLKVIGQSKDNSTSQYYYSESAIEKISDLESQLIKVVGTMVRESGFNIELDRKSPTSSAKDSSPSAKPKGLSSKSLVGYNPDKSRF